jgi:hypothetical protein
MSGMENETLLEAYSYNCRRAQAVQRRCNLQHSQISMEAVVTQRQRQALIYNGNNTAGTCCSSGPERTQRLLLGPLVRRIENGSGTAT